MAQEIIDMETGEILGGIPDLSIIARDLYDANQQIKAWEAHANALKAILLAKQPEKKVAYGDVVVSVRQQVRQGFDYQSWRGQLRLGDFSVDTLEAIIEAATGFDPVLIPVVTNPLPFRSENPTKPFIVVELARKRAAEQESEVREHGVDNV